MKKTLFLTSLAQSVLITVKHNFMLKMTIFTLITIFIFELVMTVFTF
jgi:hypothetical protein